MNKAIISNKIYMHADKDLMSELAKKLTYRIEVIRSKLGNYNTVETIRNYSIPKAGVIAIPQGRLDLIPEGYEIVDNRTVIDVDFPVPKIPLRESQIPVLENWEDSGMLNAPVGWGKSYTALWIAFKLGQKTLIVAHNTMLRDQWASDVQKLFGITPAIIGSGEFDTEGPIVIGNVQTLTKHAQSLSGEFGTIILDECLDYETSVQTLEYGTQKLGALVNKKLDCSVLSMDTETHEVSYKKVLRHFKNPQVDCIKISHSGGGSIKCTENHNLFTYYDGEVIKIEAGMLEVGDTLLQTVTRHKSSRILNKDWYPIALGIILGDGSLRLDNVIANSSRISVTHGEDQFDYLNWKSTFLLGGDTCTSQSTSGYDTDRKIRQITSKSFSDLEGWRSQMYVDGQKRLVPKTISSLLDKRSWALMYLDDGSSSKVAESIVFSFCDLDLSSCENLVTSLKEVFGLISPVIYTCNKGYNYIRLNKDDTVVFKKAISKYVHPSMHYKLNNCIIDKFEFDLPSVPMFNESFCVRSITEISKSTMTGGNRYNIEVEGTNTYFANGILVSNCHHAPATTFESIIAASKARYRIGLSGTLERKDKKHILFKDYFGSYIVKPIASNTMIPTVKVIQCGRRMLQGATYPKMINELMEDEEYRHFVAGLARAQSLKGHKVLIISDRVGFAHAMGILLPDCIVVTGESASFDDREVAKELIQTPEFNIISGTRPIFAEGISINCLSCIILTCPIAGEGLLEQLIGRVMREYPGKIDPEVIDINFVGKSAKAQNNLRLAFYLTKGWKVDLV